MLEGNTENFQSPGVAKAFSGETSNPETIKHMLQISPKKLKRFCIIGERNINQWKR